MVYVFIRREARARFVEIGCCRDMLSTEVHRACRCNFQYYGDPADLVWLPLQEIKLTYRDVNVIASTQYTVKTPSCRASSLSCCSEAARSAATEVKMQSGKW